MKAVEPGPYDWEAGAERMRRAQARKDERVERSKAGNRRRNRAARRARRDQRAATR